MSSAQSTRINLRADPELYRDLEDWAEQQKRSVASLCVYLLSRSIDQAKQDGEFVPSSSSKPATRINLLDLQRLADQLNIPSDRLLEAIQAIKLEVTNGGGS